MASENFKRVLYPDLGQSSRKKVFFPKEYLHKEKKGTPLPPTTPLSNGQKNRQKIYSTWSGTSVKNTRITLLQMLRRNAVLKLLQGCCHLLVSSAKISKNYHNMQKWFNGHLNFSYLIRLNLKPEGSFSYWGRHWQTFYHWSGGPGVIACIASPPPNPALVEANYKSTNPTYLN